jgi:hypothetical protein
MSEIKAGGGKRTCEFCGKTVFGSKIHECLQQAVSVKKLKPCPFCGGDACVKKEHAFGVDIYYPRCQTGPLNGNGSCIGNQGWVSFSTEEEAVEKWNKRAPIKIEITP